MSKQKWTKEAKQKCTYDKAINLAYRLYCLVVGETNFTDFETKFIYHTKEMYKMINEKANAQDAPG